MALNQWFKMYGGEYLSDPKIASLSAQERSCWLTLLCLASISTNPGTVEFLTVEVLLSKSGIAFDPYHPEEWNACLSVLEKFVQMRMVDKDDRGVLTITNWQKRQETALTNAERQARYRERNAKVTEHVTSVTLDKIREEEKIPALADFSIQGDLGEEKKPRTRRDKEAMSLMYKGYSLIEREYGVKPTETFADYNRVLEAKKTLTDSDILNMVEDALAKGKRTLREMLTSRAIDIYRQENV